MEYYEGDSSASTADMEDHVELDTDNCSTSIADMNDIEQRLRRQPVLGRAVELPPELADVRDAQGEERHGTDRDLARGEVREGRIGQVVARERRHLNRLRRTALLLRVRRGADTAPRRTRTDVGSRRQAQQWTTAR